MLKRASLPLDELAKRQRTALSTEDIVAIVMRREAARVNKRYDEADALRSELRSAGVELLNGEREWRANDGRRGSIVAATSARGTCDLSDETIAQLVVEREKARQAQIYSRADELRETMREQGVELLDKERIWRTTDGRVGLLPGKLTEEAILHLVQLRETERATRNFDTADRLRQALRDVGVRLDDKTSTWTCEDGRSGHFAAPAMAAVQPASHAVVSPSALAAYSAQAAVASGALAAYTGSSLPAVASAAVGSTWQMRTISELEIMVLVRQYEESRAAHDTIVQEAVEGVLRERGIALDAASLCWRAIDGRSGPIFYTDSNLYRSALTAAAYAMATVGAAGAITSTPTPTLSAAGTATPAADDLDGLLQLREQARARRDFALADRLRESLRAQGVQLNDQVEEFVMPDGRSGNYASLLLSGAPDAGGSGTMTDAEIVSLIAERENARKQRDFGHADGLRTRMRAFGVTLDDRERTWSTSDGRRGTWAE
jgi:cysteinyl-tRNA synthetase